MAQAYSTDAGTLVIPGAYSEIKVEQSNSGLSANGVLFLIGEADAGPDFTSESELAKNAFGPTQDGDVVAKYKSGNLVDAFKAIVAPANDEDFTGSWSKIVMVKTNKSVKASSAILNQAGSAYATIQDRSYGKLGNLISREIVAKSNEALPTTGAFALLPPIAATAVGFRVNGGAEVSTTLTAQQAVDAMVAAIDGLAGVAATGGADRQVLGTIGSPLACSLALTVTSGNNVRIDCTVPFAAAAQPGDTLWIRSDSVLAAAAAANVGSYIVLSVASTSITAVKVLDGSGAANALTPPTNKGSIASDGNTDLLCYSPVTIAVEASNAVAGLAKSLEVNELSSQTGLLSYIAKTYSNGVVGTPSWISKTGAATCITSATEYVAKMKFARQFDNISEEISAGGPAAFTLSYTGTSGQAVIADGVMTITVVGGAGSSPAAITLADYATLADLAQYISSLTGFKAAAGTAVLGQSPSTSLDEGTYTIASTFGALTGRIKQDAWKVFNAVNNNSVLVQLDAEPTAGQPAVTGLGFLAGGSKGSTTDAVIASAIDAIQKIKGNFVVPLFSRDGSFDVADGLTETGSTYTIDGINAYARSHVLKMATLKRRKNRQAFLSYRGTFADAKTRGANLGNNRCSMAFQDVKVAPNGTVKQYQPWMTAALAAAMQAVGFYRPIVARGINISSALQAAGDFDPDDPDQLEEALLAGLLPIKRSEDDTSWIWASDQTSYGKDNNWIYNSIQGTYVSDLVALTSAQRMEKAFLGKDIADVSASLALTTLEGIMEDMVRLKLLAKSDDAPRGFRNARIKISGPAMVVQVEIKVAGAIYFIPISFLVTQVKQSASS